MGVTCEILLRNTKCVYKAGDSVEGTVKYVIDKTTEFTSVTLSLKGKGLCFWVPITTETKYTESENYVNQRMDLLQANETVTIPAGTYEKEFCFVLPEEIPCSCKDFRCFISFFIQLKFIESNSMSVPKKFYSDIQVQGGVKPRLEDKHYVAYETKKEFMLSKKTITLIAGIKKPFLYAGEDITVKLHISNYAKVPLVASKTELIEFVSCTSNRNQVKQKSKTLKGIEIKYLGINRLKTELSQTHHFSTTPHLFSTHSNMYGVKVTLKFPFPHREHCLEIPVAIAEKIDDLEYEKLNVQDPSCWQAMNEKNEMEE